jgi:hypothetical protein
MTPIDKPLTYDPDAMNLENNGDEFYAALMEAHEGLSADQSHRLNARLVLIMANRIGDTETLRAMLDQAKKVGK